MKNFKKFIAAGLVMTMALSMAACSKVKFDEFDCDDVEDVFEDFDCEDCGWGGYYMDKGEYFMTSDSYSCFDANEYDYDTVIAGRLDHNTTIICFEFDDEDDAYEYFTEVIYEEFEDIKGDRSFSGKIRMSNSEGFGYVLVDADYDDDVYFGDITYIPGWCDFDYEHLYGGVYYINNTVCIIMNYNDGSSREIDELNSVLEALVLPQP